MHEIQIQLTDQLYEQIQRRAAEAGFASMDEYIVDVVAEDVAQETEDLDHRFTPKVTAHLDQIQHDIKSGAKTYSEEELDDYLQERAQVWRESHAT
jgi:hypothetical protein